MREYEKAIKHLKEGEIMALSDPPKYRLQLGMICDRMAIVYRAMGKIDLAVSQWKKLASEYQGIGSGKLRNSLSVNSVFQLASYYLDIKKDTSTAEQYLSNLAIEQDKNDVGYAASIELYKMNKLKGDEVKANHYLEKMSSYPVTSETQQISADVKRVDEMVEARKRLKKE